MITGMNQAQTNAIAMVALNQGKFRHDFTTWLAGNWHVFEYFAHAANAVWSHGWRHYSARTIWEVMRHRSAVRETACTFKLNDHRVPDVARLYMLMHPEHAGLFEFRERKAA